MAISPGPQELLTPERLDVLARLDFVEGHLRGRQNSWSQRLYRDLLDTTTPFGDFGEDGVKFSIEDYERSFEGLIDSLQSQGFNPELSKIPTNSRGIINGAHRLAACLALGTTPSIEASDDEQATHYSFAGLAKAGLPQDQTDYLAWRYTQKKTLTRGLLFNNISNSDFKKCLLRLRKKTGRPEVYSGELLLSDIGKRRLLQLAYGHLDWWDDSLIEKLLAERYLGRERSNYFVLISTEREGDELALKYDLRKLLGERLGLDRQIHGTDNHHETLRIAECLLNRNSRQFLNLAPIGAEYRLLSEFSEIGMQPNYEGNLDWCIDGGSVLEMFGLRPASDVDYITGSTVPLRFPKADFRNPLYKSDSMNPDEVIYDPSKHFRFGGIKFASLAERAAHSTRKADPKSIADLILIGRSLSSNPAIYSHTVPGHSQGAWKLRVWVGRKLETVLSFLPWELAQVSRKVLRFLGSIVWR